MIPGLSSSRNLELAEEGLEINMSLVRKYAEASRESASKLGREETAETFGLILDQVDDAFAELHPQQQTLGRPV